MVLLSDPNVSYTPGTMSEDQLTKLFNYMHVRFDRLEQELARKADSDVMLTKLDGILARLDTDDTERVMLGRQVDRHQKWIKQLAKNSKTKLQPQPD